MNFPFQRMIPSSAATLSAHSFLVIYTAYLTCQIREASGHPSRTSVKPRWIQASTEFLLGRGRLHRRTSLLLPTSSNGKSRRAFR